jgi:iron complex outermembrane receptor protein
VAAWGADDNLQNTFAHNNELKGAWWDPAHANYVGDAVLAANPRLGECKDGNTERTFDYDDGIIRDEGCLYNETLGYDIYTYATAYGPISMQNGRIDNDFDDWRIRLEYDVSPDWLTYFTIASGHKSGGFNDNIAGTTADVSTGRAGTAPTEFDSTTEAPAYDGESVIYYELGSKSEFDLGLTAVTLNSSAFYYDYNDMIVTTLTSVGSILSSRGVNLSSIVDRTEDGSDISSGSVATYGGLNQIVSYSYNAAQAEIYGLHFDAKFDFENRVNFDVSAVLMETEINAPDLINDSRYEKYENDFIVAEMRSVDGHELPRSPKLQLRSGIRTKGDLYARFVGSPERILNLWPNSRRLRTNNRG